MGGLRAGGGEPERWGGGLGGGDGLGAADARGDAEIIAVAVVGPGWDGGGDRGLLDRVGFSDGLHGMGPEGDRLLAGLLALGETALGLVDSRWRLTALPRSRMMRLGATSGSAASPRAPSA